MKQTANHSNTRKIFNGLFFTHLLLNLTNCLCEIASGYIAGNLLDTIAVSCNSLISPFHSVIIGIATIFSTGGEILCGRFMGNGDKKSLNKTFTNAITLAVISGIALTAIAICFAGPIVNLLGANQEIYEAAKIYLSAFALGTIAYILMPVLVTFLHMENEGTYVTKSVILLAVSYAIFGFLFIKVLKLNYFGFGLTNAFSQIVTVIFLAVRIIKNKDQLFFDKKELNFNNSSKILTLGFVSGVSRILIAGRNIVLNIILMDTGGVLAMAAKSIMGSGLCVIDAVTQSIVITVTMLGSICAGEKNKDEINELLKYVFTRILPYQAMLLIAEAIIARPVCSLFSTDPAAIELATITSRIYYTSVLFETFCNILLSFYTIFEYQKFVNFVNILHSMVFHVVYSLLFKNLLGQYSVFSGYTVTEILTTLTIITYICIKNKRFPTSINQLILIRKDFNNAIKYSKTIRNYDDVTNVSSEVTDFCLTNNVNKRLANLAGLSIEEMCANIFEHGFTKKKVKEEKVDIFVLIEKDELILRIRDNAIAFNPTTRSLVFSPEDPCKNVGIRLVSKISKEMTYQNIFGFNNMIIKL